MNAPEHFHIVGERGEFRPSGHVSLEAGVAMVTSALAFAREQKIRQLLVNVSALTGFVSPTVTERYFFVREWAQAARGEVRVAFVARPEMIDPQKFGVMVAANNGLQSDVFASEDEALAWLKKDT